MDDQQRDYAEEAYNRDTCPVCDGQHDRSEPCHAVVRSSPGRAYVEILPDVERFERGVEYRVWVENGDLVWVGTDRAERDREMADAIARHVAESGCSGCGVLTPPEHHGISIQICDGDRDVTGDPTYG